ncbi:hypothetical protein K435DRAFT_849750 [Dendrothele bispora CBS 962.96]|uniref:GATOR2 complex protein MIO zinc-ribbon like domain-containing protein n=1 Tax=Dendrothele bispora (strain CBS 962.96) TaxID=1314807 RepID=A0A4S8MSX2_DENBC|nr:hypothetical protein K435DRAFT_849750 [Dendrothele bispora CBS 962.96]
MKQVLWSPLSTSTFLVGGGSQLTLYNYRNDKIDLVTSIDDLNVRQGSSLQCFAWCPSKSIDDLVAVGHSTGRVDLLRLGPSRHAEPGSVVSLPVRNQRPCSALSWRDSSYLAVGLDKVRGDASLLVWDITQSLPVFSNRTIASTTSINNARIIQQAQAELVSAVAWSTGSNSLLLTSISNRWLRLFDIREGGTPIVNIASKVHGITIDPFDENRFACWGDGVVNIWDLRKLTGNNGGSSTTGSNSSGTTAHPILSFTEHDAAGDGGVSALYNPHFPVASPLSSPLTSSSSPAASAFSSSRTASRLRTQSAGGSSSTTLAGTPLPPYRHAMFSSTRRGTLATLAKDAACVRVWDVLEAKAYSLYSSNLPKGSQNQVVSEQQPQQQASNAVPTSKRSWASLAAYMPGGGDEKEAPTLPQIQLQRRSSSIHDLGARGREKDFLVLADTKRTSPFFCPDSKNSSNPNAPSSASSAPSPTALSSFAFIPSPFSTTSYHRSCSDDSDTSDSESERERLDLESVHAQLSGKVETKVLLLAPSGSLAISTVQDAPKYRGSWSARGEMILDYAEEVFPSIIAVSPMEGEPESRSTRDKARDSKRSLSRPKSKSRSISRSKRESEKQKKQANKVEKVKEKYGQVLQTLQTDVSMVMKARAEKGYSVDDPILNVSILRDTGRWISEDSTLEAANVGNENTKLGLGLDDLLADTWEWVANAHRLLSTPTSLIYGWDFAYAGVWDLWIGPRGVPRYHSATTGQSGVQMRSHDHTNAEKDHIPLPNISHRMPAPLGPQSSLSSIASAGSDDSTGTVASVATGTSSGTSGRGGPGFGGFGKPTPESPPLRGYETPSRSDSLSSISSMTSMGLGRFEAGMISSSPASSSIHSHASSYTGGGSGSMTGSIASFTGSAGSGSGGSVSGSHHGSLGSNISTGLGLHNPNTSYDDGRQDEIKILEEEATPVHKDRLELLPDSDLLRSHRERAETRREPGSPGFLSTKNQRQQQSGHRTRRSWSPSVAGRLGGSGLGSSSNAVNTDDSSTPRGVGGAIPSEEGEWFAALEVLGARADAQSSVEHGVMSGISAGKLKSSNRHSWNANNQWNAWSPCIPVPTTRLLQRKICLEMLGWGFIMRERDSDWDALETGTATVTDEPILGLKDAIRKWELYGLKDMEHGTEGTKIKITWDGYARAACWLVLMGKYEAAAQCLLRSGDESHHMMSGTIIALAPFCTAQYVLSTSASTSSLVGSASFIAPNLKPNPATQANLTPTPTRTQLPSVYSHVPKNLPTLTQNIPTPRLSPALRDHYTKLTNKLQDPYLKLLLTHMTQLALDSDSSNQNAQNTANTGISIYAFPGPVASSGLTSGQNPSPTRTPLLYVLESHEMQIHLPFRERLAMAFAFLDDEGVTEYLRRIWEVCHPDSHGYTHNYPYGESYAFSTSSSDSGSGLQRSRSRTSSSQSSQGDISMSLRRRKSWDGAGGGGTEAHASGAGVRQGSLSRTSTRESIRSSFGRTSESVNESHPDHSASGLKKSRKGDTSKLSQTTRTGEPSPPQHVGGDIDALIVVGAGTAEGREVLRRWVDRVGDVQSAAMLGWLGACVGVNPSSAAGKENMRGRKGNNLNPSGLQALSRPKASGYSMDLRVERWVEAYRDLLDGLRMFHSRVEFDIARGEILRGALLQNSSTIGPASYPLQEPLVPRQILIRCNYCNKSIVPPSPTTVTSTAQAQTQVSGLGLSLGTGPARTHRHSNQGSTDSGTRNVTGATKKNKPTVCPSCKRSLPRCSVCLMTLGIVPDAMREIELSDASSGSRIKDTMDEAIIICQTCRHGGHASHILEWFFGTDEADIPEQDDAQARIYSRLNLVGRGSTKVARTCPVADCNCHCADEM